MSEVRTGAFRRVLAWGIGAASLAFLLMPWRWRPWVAFRLRWLIYSLQRWCPPFHNFYKGLTAEQESALKPETSDEPEQAEPIPDGDEVVLLYSGGVDSTLAAALLAPHFRKVRLCTFQTRYMHDAQETTRNLPRLRERYGEDKFEHVFLPANPYVEHVFLSQFRRDLKRWGLFKANFCGACKVAFTIAITKYCLDNGIRYIASGANREFGAGEFFIGQMPATVPIFHEFFARYGITMLSPVYHLQRNDKRLHEMGLLDDWRGAKQGSLTEGAQTIEGLRARGQIACDQDVFTTLYNQGCGIPLMGPDAFRERSVEYTQALLDEFAPQWLKAPAVESH